MLLIIHTVVVVLFIILGFVFLSGKGLFLIAGYNTAFKSDKAKTDKKKLCKYMAKLMFLFAGCFIIVIVSDIFESMWIMALGLVLCIVVAVGSIVYINRGNRLKK